jgi:hypothetical protein
VADQTALGVILFIEHGLQDLQQREIAPTLPGFLHCRLVAFDDLFPSLK